MVYTASFKMKLFRLCKEKYATLDGYGAFLYGGRWNLPGKAVVYTAENRALAALEFLVGIEQHRQLGPLIMLTLEIPHSLKKDAIVESDLPAGWRQFPAPESLARLGNDWLEKNQCCALRVPSVHVPEEYNFLLNPRHADFAQVQVMERKAFQFDDRLLP